MKSFGSRWPAAYKSFCAFFAFLFVLPAASATTRPRYGGVLRVEFLAASVSLDPRTWKPGSRDNTANERLAALVYDRLVSLDNYGRFIPQLATEWSHDGAFRRWQFAIRSGVKFSDGTPLTAAEAAHALSALLPEGLQVSVSGNSVVIQSADSRPDLLEVLASGRFFIVHETSDSAILGTGPFTLDTISKDTKAISGDAVATAATATQHLRFSDNESCWAGRPFLDAVDVTVGVTPLRALFDLQAGKVDLVELAPDIARRAAQSNTRIWSSSALTLYALRFEASSAHAANDVLREALSLSLDRATMASVLLQKQAEPASALLPQWLSGYAFLFRSETDAERAKQLRASLPANVAGGTAPLRVQAEASGDLARLLAERVAVNARQAGLSVQPLNKTAAAREAKAQSQEPADLHLFAWRYSSLSPAQELRDFASAEHAQDAKEGNPADPDRRYAWERKILEERKVIPLVFLPDYAGLAPAIRDWQPTPWGEWRLADVWLELTAKNPASNPNNAGTGARP
ncbi:MAG TPA: ABC transporter substrate-binding protein [Candidatus Acidoferrum sp.]|nr:ABC transporter substrate-binding protein [Candidatus Acidoferrum sp.]